MVISDFGARFRGPKAPIKMGARRGNATSSRSEVEDDEPSHDIDTCAPLDLA